MWNARGKKLRGVWATVLICVFPALAAGDCDPNWDEIERPTELVANGGFEHSANAQVIVVDDETIELNFYGGVLRLKKADAKPGE